MVIKIKNGKATTYEYRDELFRSGYRLVKKNNGHSYFEKHIKDKKYESILIEINHFKAKGLIVETIPDNYTRSKNYREKFFKNAEPVKKYRCVYCGKRLPKEKITIDHIYPVAKASTRRGKKHLKKKGIYNINDEKNLAPSCKHCNSSKGQKAGIWILKAHLGQHEWFWKIRAILLFILFAACGISTYIAITNLQNILK